jgi:hypothetical protein
MNNRTRAKATLIASFVLISLGGFILHFRFHSPFLTPHGYGYLPFAVGLIGLLVLPVLFWFRSTTAYAFVINTMLVIIGTITMANFSVHYFKVPLTLYNIVFNTLLADIAILWANFAIGWLIFNLEQLRSDQPPSVFDLKRFFRYPNFGWVLVHLAALSAVYALGKILWQ